jgi:hypothetical protein
VELFLPAATGLTNLDTRAWPNAWAARSIAPEVFNCSAPDTGNMEVLPMFGNARRRRAGSSRCSPARSAPPSR